MGRKSNPISLRIYKNTIGASQWYAHENFTTVLYDDLLIREMVNHIYQQRFKSWVNQVVIKRTSHTLYVYVFIFASRENYINIDYSDHLQKMIQRYLNVYDQKIEIVTYNYYKVYKIEKNDVYERIAKNFAHLRWLQLQYEFFRLAFVSVYSKNITAFCNFLAVRLSRARRHRKLIYIARDLFSRLIQYENDLVGIRIRFNGRIDGRPRAKKMYLQKGNVPLHTISAHISYHLSHVFSRYGTFGLKIWLCFTKSEIFYFHQLRELRNALKAERKSEQFGINYSSTTAIPKEKLHSSLAIDNHSNIMPDPEFLSFSFQKLRTSMLNMSKNKHLNEYLNLQNRKAFLVWLFFMKYKHFIKKDFDVKTFLRYQMNHVEIRENNMYLNLLNKTYRLTQKMKTLKMKHYRKKLAKLSRSKKYYYDGKGRVVFESKAKKTFDDYDLDDFKYKKQVAKEMFLEQKSRQNKGPLKQKEKHRSNVKRRKITNKPKNFKSNFASRQAKKVLELKFSQNKRLGKKPFQKTPFKKQYKSFPVKKDHFYRGKPFEKKEFQTRIPIKRELQQEKASIKRENFKKPFEGKSNLNLNQQNIERKVFGQQKNFIKEGRFNKNKSFEKKDNFNKDKQQHFEKGKNLNTSKSQFNKNFDGRKALNQKNQHLDKKSFSERRGDKKSNENFHKKYKTFEEKEKKFGKREFIQKKNITFKNEAFSKDTKTKKTE